MRRLLLLLAVLAPAVGAQTSSELVTWRVGAERAERGETARVVLDAEVAPGWRLYGLGSTVGVPLSVTLEELPGGVALGPLSQVGAREGYDEVFEANYPYFLGTGRVVQRVAVGRRAARGRHRLEGRIRYAVCDDRICLPPATSTFRVSLVVE